MRRSEVVVQLAKMASSGRYNVNVQEAQAMNKLYEEVALVINTLTIEERANDEQALLLEEEMAAFAEEEEDNDGE